MTYGTVGNGTTGAAETPSLVVGLTEATEIAGGYYHSLGLRANGTVMAWGYNGSGQLGDGTTTETSAPVPVSGLSNVVSVSAGGEHSLALLSNGTVMAWGDNAYGELGSGGTTGPDTCGLSASACSKVPVPVPGITNAIAIAAGYYDNMALLADGTVVVWGYDYYGEQRHRGRNRLRVHSHPVHVGRSEPGSGDLQRLVSRRRPALRRNPSGMGV